MKKYPIIFLGTPEFAVPTLEALVRDGRFEIVTVICEPDRPAGRGMRTKSSAIKLLAKENSIPVWQPEKIENWKLKIGNLQPDLAVVVAYGQIIPQEILEIPKFGFLNIHPSLLPKYRGPSPIQSTILNGDKETGVTIIKLDEKMDHGDVVAKSKIKNQKSKLWNYLDLSNKLADLGANLLIKILTDYLEGKIEPEPQNHQIATYTKLIKKSDGLIDWNEPNEIIQRKIRAYNPWPGTYTFLGGKRLKICQAHISCGKLIINKVQLEGKKEISWSDFCKGYKKEIPFLDKTK